ncbi:MAG: DUF2851 family protein [Bacteroidetes bacterium]|nr:DUF2851 family protein [Bacteroidota bacterium]
MTERLLQFIWQMQYFNKSSLCTSAGESLTIQHPGLFNTNQGPDFLQAKIKIGTTSWVGNVELHIRSSDWKSHNHEDDDNYSNVMLHVVWEHDSKGTDESARNIPLLILQDRVSKFLLTRYEELMYNHTIIACEKTAHTVPAFIWDAWKTRLAAERLERKSLIFQSYLRQTNNHWEEVFWWILAKNFGATVNAEAFEAMARSVPVNILAKHKNQIHQIEALLLGQAGLLNADFTESYPVMLQKEYRFLREKYTLKPIHEPVHFLRMRPGNFPTIRLAQLAMLIHRSSHLFAQIKEIPSPNEVMELFTVTANDYWHYHYRLDEPSSFRPKITGNMIIQNVIINTAVPAIFTYGVVNKELRFKIKALQWLESIAPEENRITRKWEQLGIHNVSALDSQALTELTKEYCLYKNCLQCAAGAAILRGSI